MYTILLLVLLCAETTSCAKLQSEAEVSNHEESIEVD